MKKLQQKNGPSLFDQEYKTDLYGSVLLGAGLISMAVLANLQPKQPPYKQQNQNTISKPSPRFTALSGENQGYLDKISTYQQEITGELKRIETLEDPSVISKQADCIKKENCSTSINSSVQNIDCNSDESFLSPQDCKTYQLSQKTQSDYYLAQCHNALLHCLADIK